MSENKFINAYNNMVKHLHDALGGTAKTVAHGLDVAKEKTSAAGDLTKEEIDKVSGYVKRDVEDAAHALDDSKDESLSEWLKFDIELLENFALDAFMNVADKTRIELAKIEQLARETNTYHAGDITSPGTFVCTQCSKKINFKSTSEIPTCPECGGKTFQRC
jgi:zinc ribbon family protein